MQVVMIACKILEHFLACIIVALGNSPVTDKAFAARRNGLDAVGNLICRPCHIPYADFIRHSLTAIPPHVTRSPMAIAATDTHE